MRSKIQFLRSHHIGGFCFFSSIFDEYPISYYVGKVHREGFSQRGVLSTQRGGLHREGVYTERGLHNTNQYFIRTYRALKSPFVVIIVVIIASLQRRQVYNSVASAIFH
jgi:hypothetical protein